MKFTLITPHVGRKKANEYVRTWQMEPLGIATLAGLVPEDVELAYFDERIEPIDFDAPTDLAGITVETYTAKRAYEIAAEYRRRGVPVILGGYHVTLVPEEAIRFADSILVGDAEGVLPQVLRDAEEGQLARRYAAPAGTPKSFAMPRRDIFAGRNYLPMSCVETGRGCPFHCTFCSIAAANQAGFRSRPIDDVVADVAAARDIIFFVDDNIVGSFRNAKELFRALIPLKIRWFSQGTLNMARDPELLRLMRESGCLGVLIGFESVRPENLRKMRKNVNLLQKDTAEAVRKIHDAGIGIYGTFIYGFEDDPLAEWEETIEFALRLKLFMGAFNQLIPFPGTPLYRELREAGRLTEEAWWLNPEFRFNDAPLIPEGGVSGEDIRQACLQARRRFYSWPNILRRASNVRGNLTSFRKASGYLTINAMLRQEIGQKDRLPLGDEPRRPVPQLPAEPDAVAVLAGKR